MLADIESAAMSFLHNSFYQTLGMVARWRPVHLGHEVVLHALCDSAAQVRIGIGSANRYNARNPFTLAETCDMIHLVLRGRTNYELIAVDDLDDGPRWRAMLRDLFGPLDVFVSDNPYVANLMRETYPVIRPISLVPPEKRLPLDGTQVRRAMARGEGWQRLVPAPVAAYIQTNGLDVRFRREFGLQTLAMETLNQDT
jgi:nicotinamide-nucleotide adenylyltransferase